MAPRPKAPEPVPAPAAAPAPKKQKRYKRDPNKPKRAYRVKPGMKPGRPPYKPTKEQRDVVRVMVAAGIQQRVIARALGINQETLAVHFRHELDDGMEEANGIVVSNLFHQTATNPRAAEFWLVNRDPSRWKNNFRQEVQLSGADGGAVKIETRNATIERLMSLLVRDGVENAAPTVIDHKK